MVEVHKAVPKTTYWFNFPFYSGYNREAKRHFGSCRNRWIYDAYQWVYTYTQLRSSFFTPATSTSIPPPPHHRHIDNLPVSASINNYLGWSCKFKMYFTTSKRKPQSVPTINEAFYEMDLKLHMLGFPPFFRGGGTAYKFLVSYYASLHTFPIHLWTSCA